MIVLSKDGRQERTQRMSRWNPFRPTSERIDMDSIGPEDEWAGKAISERLIFLAGRLIRLAILSPLAKSVRRLSV